MRAAVAKCLVVSNVLVADGMMREGEREFLAALIREQGLTDEERKQVTELEGLDEAEVIVRALPEDERRAIVAKLLDAAAADGRLSALELATIQRVATALDIES